MNIVETKIAVLGGNGYLGSCIVDELRMSGNIVDSYDINMFFDEEDQNSNNQIIDIFDCEPETFIQYKKVIWCIDIDVENFYTTEISKKYIKLNLDYFKMLTNTVKNSRVMLITDLYMGDNKSYIDFIKEKVDICRNYQNSVYFVPALYGTSRRMRFDNYINNIMLHLLIGSNITISNWLDQFYTCSIPSLCIRIREDIKNNLHVNCGFYTDVFSKIEYFMMIKECFEENIEPNFSFEKLTSEKRRDMENPFGVVVDELEINGRFTLIKTFKHLIDGIGKGIISDPLKDKFYNEKIISGLFHSDAVIKLRNKLMD